MTAGDIFTLASLVAMALFVPLFVARFAVPERNPNKEKGDEAT